MGFLTKIRASVDVFAFLCRSFAALAIVLAFWPNRLAYAEPAAGPRAEIVGARIGADRRAIATIKLSDAKGQPLDLDNLDSDSVKFTIAVIRAVKSGETSYHNYILTRVTGNEFVHKGETRKPALTATLQPDFDRGGVFTRVRPGIFTYTFKTALPADYDRRATHVIGGEFTREKGKFVANPLFEFVPSGAKVKMQRDVVETASCNNCHDPLKYHGGTRREAGYCALCHTPQLTDPETGESLEFKVFVHKIHRGKLLPSVREGKFFLLSGRTNASPIFPRFATRRHCRVTAYCSGCHGLSGKGDGPAAKTLPVKPADHTRIEMNKYTDQYLVEIISKGGAGVGKSSQMPAWGAVFKEPQVKEIVAYVRALSNGKKETAQVRGAQSNKALERFGQQAWLLTNLFFRNRAGAGELKVQHPQ
jgi:hypothetical protein